MSPTSKPTEQNAPPPPPAAMSHTMDHFILAINDLDKGMAEFETMTGVKPAYGGIHPHSFTHNAIASLGDNLYIEIIAPRPNATHVPEEFKSFTHLTPFGWAINSKAITGTEEKLKALGYKTAAIRPGARQRPDGQSLAWSTLALQDSLSSFDPFFIQWEATTVHPSVSAPEGCTLAMVQWALTSPQRFKQLLDAFDLPGEVVTSAAGEDRMRISLRTPRGVANF